MDTKTVVVVAILSQTGLALGMLLTAATQRVYAGFRFWTAFFISLPVTFLLLALRGQIPDFLSILVANATSLYGLVLLHEGTHRFLSLPGRPPWKVNVPVTTATLCGLAWFTYIDRNVSSRIVISCAAQAFICFRAGFGPYLVKRVRRSSALFLLSSSLVIYGAFALVRGGRAILVPVEEIMREGWSYDVFVIFIVVLTVANMMGCLLMTHERSLSLASEARRSLQTLLSNLRGVAYRVRLDGEQTIEYVSEGVEELSGYPRERFLGKPVEAYRELVNREDNEANHAAVVRALAEGRHYAVTYRVRHATGRTLWVWDQGVGVRDEAGNFVFREGFITDITERVEAEAEKERLLVELKTALNEVRTLSGLIPICASCKKIRDDKGYWNCLEQYLMDHTNADFTHGICPECANRLYPLK